jgi:hypothetical protein
MLSHYTGPQCSRSFLRLCQSKLLLVETECVANIRRADTSVLCFLAASAPGVEVWTLVWDRNPNQCGTDPFY